ncbi:A Receptor for Ubiquitination Targets [Rhizoctonia solani]|uniref:A Receptor for Ubiquitination Targets n=1 Tax=Rhizoctonia solani TaxID=456999 RepID=A0A8H7II65_9AGAM|nr:A Receptor for Ubiquitination Targets [Rhizoctonia solani]
MGSTGSLLVPDAFASHHIIRPQHVFTSGAWGAPNDVLTIMILCMELRSILALSETCRMFYDIIQNSATIQLYLELAADQVILNTRLRQTRRSIEWLEDLVRIRKGWLNLQMTALPPIKLSCEDNEMLSAVQSGVFAYGASTPGQPDGINRVKIVKLPHFPSMLRQKDSNSPSGVYPGSIVSNGSHISAFRGCPEQDLMILGSLTGNGPCLSVHTISEGARTPWPEVITLGSKQTGRTGPELLQWEILIWNWKTGALVFRKSTTSQSTAFTFLSTSSYILAEQQGTKAYLLVGDIEAESEMPTDTPCFKFELPELSPGWGYGPLYFKNELPSAVPDSCESTQGFMADPRTGVIYLSVGLTGPISSLAGARTAFIPHIGLFISRASILDTISQPQYRSCELVDLHWSRWGEHATRWFDVGETPGLLSPVHGSRVIQLVRRHPAGTSWLQREADTNRQLQHIVRAIEQYIVSYSLGGFSSNSAFVERFCKEHPTILDIPGAFLHKVVSRLPYRCVTHITPQNPGAEWILDGEYLLRVDEPAEGNGFCMVQPYAIFDRS